ncbi:hypothetical protein POM88_049858 [Heracleum sosnowskyi]|uniref:Transposase-associated domain-containing protein n=1 Tax=Heracleum sosnowskyi TaxID=360622 RepID=A0AAD8GWI4_9APIA|nr:hypothetical protein POM88_049858 [Heracleum sosnowskyi]
MNLSSDRSWMGRRKSSTEIGATAEFRAGCQVFLEYAYSHPKCVNDKNQIRCPCHKCKNNNYLDRDIVNYHLLVTGFMKNYEECWWAHGQTRDGGFTVNNPRSSSNYHMNEMVHNMAGPDFDWEQAREQPMNSDAKDFFKLLDEGSEPLWDGCTRHSKLSAVATILNIKADHNMSHEVFVNKLIDQKQKRYRWADEDAAVISTLFWQKCAARTKDKFSKDRQKALNNAGVDYPGQGVLHMHEYGPWWCSADIWTQMCEQWRDEKWVQKRYTAANNRSAGAPVGEKAKGTYRGGSISQLQHIANKESECEGTRINWLDVYVSTRDGLPDAQKIADDYRRLLDERYPEGTERPEIDQELWERASIVKKNYIKGQGQRRRSSFSGSFSGSGSTQLSQSSSHPPTHTPADCVRAICRDRELLRILGGHLGALDPDELARAVAEAASSSQQDDGSQGSHHGAGDGESGGS